MWLEEVQETAAFTDVVFPFDQKKYIYTAYKRNIILHGIETWSVKEENVYRLRSTEMRIIR